jgi:CBS-domain-containing membrane protein
VTDGIPEKAASFDSKMRNELIVMSLHEYLQKMRTLRRCSVARPPLSECFWALLGSFAGIGAVTYLSLIQGIPVVVASLGASACLIYGVPSVPLAQPRNAIAGHLLSAAIGVCIYQLAGAYWYTAGLSVGLAVAVMVGTRTVHPPAGATALIAILTKQDWLFVILPVGVGICILVGVGLMVNNLAAKRQYPVYWW